MDTILQMIKYIRQSQENDIFVPPLIVYPTRKHPISVITLKSFKNQFKLVTDHWRIDIPVLLQPLQAIDNNVELHKELRWLIKHNATGIYNYFVYGALNKSALKHHPDYGNEYVQNLKWTVNKQSRTYEELHKLATTMSKDNFFAQIKTNEVPLAIYKALINRWAKGAYTVPIINNLPYTSDYIDYRKEKYNILDYLYATDAVVPDSRTLLRIPNNR
ncbi:hypothetical protein [Lactobacillus sp. ESL0230]|uniref:hypothetical protein n=1 Tax=Lactobacillus sp. ESL0230 TaxID=2069353 RepID=UPI000EFA8418|nr:hypothetical protein [Lactobacillus sp. ESL0230]RMC46726.1 hypothetical protein F5ESL0230_05600 [Lactobacillus sp. ESL0230]